MQRNLRTPITFVALTLLWAAPAFAQRPHSQLVDGRAWAQNVPVEKQQAAARFFEEGNQALKQSLFTEAEEHYRKALDLWNHPAIHYNLALTLLNLSRPAEVYEHMMESMVYGKVPLEEPRYNHAKMYTEGRRAANAWVTVTTSPGVSVALTTGEHLKKVREGHFEGLVRPGDHIFIATKPGENYLPTKVVRTLAAAENVQLEIKVYTTEERTRPVRLWATWKPWSVVGAGAALAAGGGLLHLQARKNYLNFDKGVEVCAKPQAEGCKPSSELASMRTRGDTLRKAAVGTWVASGAAIVTGVVLVYVNRPQRQIVDVDENGQLLAVTPLVGGGTRGVLASFSF